MAQHLAFPLAVADSGALASLEQDTIEEIAASAALLLATRPGERRSVPDYGAPDPRFGGMDTSAVADALSEWEERADPALLDQIAAGRHEVANAYPGATDLTTAASGTDEEV